MRRAFITGVTGQDGSYLAELLLAKGYTIYGLMRSTSTSSLARIEHLVTHPFFHLISGDILDLSSILRAVQETQPQEIYHLAALSSVALSFQQPFASVQSIVQGTLHLLEAVRTVAPECRVYLACSAEQFGNNGQKIQREDAPFVPASPYGIAKLAAYHLACNYRQRYQLHVSCGLLFNHESPRRSPMFVPRKITQAVARIVQGTQQKLLLGNLDAVRDWGHASEYVEAMWLMLQQAQPDDYIIATGCAHTIREFLQQAFALAGIAHWEHYIEHEPSLMRPVEIDSLIGDARKAREKLGWRPTITFPQLIELMMRYDLGLVKGESMITG